MNFESRIKKQLSEGIVQAVLEDAGYRVIGSGVESIVRETVCLTALEYAGLDFPKALRSMPDFIVLDRGQTQKFMVEVKYRGKWDKGIFDEIEEQVRLFREIVLVYLNSNPEMPQGREASPATYLRCCRVRYREDACQVETITQRGARWVSVAELGAHAGQWWGLQPLQKLFTAIQGKKDERTLLTAITALKGILDIGTQSTRQEKDGATSPASLSARPPLRCIA